MTSTENQMDMTDAICQCVTVAIQNRHLSRGLNECARALDQRHAVLCILSRECDSENYSKLIMAMCNEHNIPIIEVDNGKQLAVWSRLVKFDEDGEVKRYPKCTCVVVNQWDPQSAAAQAVINQLVNGNSK